MGQLKNYAFENLKIIKAYIDETVVDGSNILYSMIPKGEFGFAKLLHTMLCRKVKLVMDENIPSLRE